MGDEIACSVVQREHIRTWPPHTSDTATKVLPFLRYSCSNELQSRSTAILSQRNPLSSLQTGAERVILQGWVPHGACEEIPSVPQMRRLCPGTQEPGTCQRMAQQLSAIEHGSGTKPFKRHPKFKRLGSALYEGQGCQTRMQRTLRHSCTLCYSTPRPPKQTSRQGWQVRVSGLRSLQPP